MSSVRNSRPWERLNVRLAIWHSGLVFVIISAVLLLSYFALRTRLDEQDHDDVLFRLNQYSSEYKRSGVPGVISLAGLRKGRAQKAFFVRIATAENRTLFERDTDDWAEFAPAQLEQRPIHKEGTQWITLPSAQGYGLLIAATRLQDGGIVQVGKSTEEAFLVLKQFRLVTVLMLAISLPVSFLGGAFLAGRALRPLRSLTRTVREIEETARFSMRTPESGSGDELDELARVFNATMGRIERLLKTMRESLDNVAHDLRTPMTRMRHRVQIALEENAEPASLREALIGCIEESDRVLEMLNTLMDIAEAEAGLTKAAVTRVNLAEIADLVCDLYAEVAEDRGVAVTRDLSEDCVVKGDSVLLRRVIANLLDNALKYTPQGGSAHLELRRSDGVVQLTVRDTGVGISTEDLPKVWERLFRSDRSRTEHGLGLGLSFVKAAVEASGGTVHAQSVPAHGSTFTIHLPAADAGAALRPISAV